MAAPLPPPTPPHDTDETIGIVIVGLGRAGKFHLASVTSLAPRARLVAVVDADAAAASAALAAAGSPAPVYSPEDAAAVVGGPGVRGVVVSSPTHTHEEVVRVALEAGKAVLCEKPLATTTAGTAALFDLAARRGQPLLVGFQRRFDDTFAAAREAVAAGAAGDVHFLRSTSRDSPMPSLDYLKISGGLFHDCVVHDVDMVLWQAASRGLRPVAVSAVASCFDEGIAAIGDVDTASVQVRFCSGAIAVIDVSRCAAYGYDQRVEVFGSAGMVEAKNQSPTSLVVSGPAGATKAPIHHSFPTRYKQAYASEFAHFLDVASGAAESATPAADVLLSLAVVDAACESVRTGREVVVAAAA